MLPGAAGRAVRAGRFQVMLDRRWIVTLCDNGILRLGVAAVVCGASGPPELGFRTVRSVSDYIGQELRRNFTLRGMVFGESEGALDSSCVGQVLDSDFV